MNFFEENNNTGLGIIIALLLLVSIFALMVDENRINSGEQSSHRELSHKAKLVKDFLSGKAIFAQDAWWFYGDQHSRISEKKLVATELGMDYADLKSKLDKRSCFVVYKSPENLEF